MQCLETLLGPEAYFAFLAIVVGTIINPVKRLPWIPVNAVPAIAFVLGWVLDVTSGIYTCGLDQHVAILSGLGGGLAGLAAAGGHEALMRSATVFGFEDRAARLLGRAKKEQDTRKKASGALIVFLAMIFLSGCAGLLPALAKASQGAQWLGTVIQVADAGSDAYFARHPNQANEQQVEQALYQAKQALSALDAVYATVDALDNEDVTQARTEAVKAYSELRDLLADLGILSATPPPGGAESDAPDPEPFALPMPATIGASL